MITVYYRDEGHIEARVLTAAEALPDDVCWVDLNSPTDEERAAISLATGIDLPTQSEMQEIEASSRLYVDRGDIYLTTTLLIGADSGEPELDDLLIVVTQSHLVLMHFCEPKSIEIFTARARRHPDLAANANTALLTLLDAMADRSADKLEILGGNVDKLSQQIFCNPRRQGQHGLMRRLLRSRKDISTGDAISPTRLRDILQGVGRAGDVLHRCYRSINAMIRTVAFVAQALDGKLDAEQAVLMQTLQSDLRSLRDHANFLIQEATFLLDATLGQINSDQNDSFRFLAIASVLLLPSNLLTGFYGMNISDLPHAANPSTVWVLCSIMALTIIVALAYFRRRGWW